MDMKNLSINELKEEYEKIGLLDHYINVYEYKNKKAIEEEFDTKQYNPSLKLEHIIKVGEFILAYEKIKMGKH